MIPMATFEDDDARLPPELGIPQSASIVKVSVIDTTARISIPADVTVEPRVGAYRTMNCPALSFLIEHESNGQKLLYDLGVPKHWKDVFPKPVVEKLTENHWGVEVKQNVVDILREQGIDPSSINAVIWSHWHWDHVGDPATFPPSTSLIVGPGFKEEFIPGWPTNPDARVHESAFAGREVREISFIKPDSETIKLGDFDAYDYFGDGTFYLIDSPGHAIGHLCALARTSAGIEPTFIFMCGDACHHGGEFRPTEYLPLPKEVTPDPLRSVATAKLHSCPGQTFFDLHPNKSRTTPFFQPSGGYDLGKCKQSIRRMEAFDAHENIFCVMAHDHTLLEIIDFYPRSANEWKSKQWKKASLWRFLGDFVENEDKEC